MPAAPPRDTRSRSPPRLRYRPGPSNLRAPAPQLIQISLPVHLALEFQEVLEAPAPGVVSKCLVDHVRLRLAGGCLQRARERLVVEIESGPHGGTSIQMIRGIDLHRNRRPSLRWSAHATV